jgi:hypothetical protein
MVLVSGKEKESVSWSNTLVLLPTGANYRGTHKHYSVIKVLEIYSYTTVKKWKGAALSSPSLKGKGSSRADMINARILLRKLPE